MTLEQIKNKFDLCFKKSNISAYEFTTDEDYEADLYIDSKEQFYLYGIKTPYVCEDFESIKYHVDEEDTDDWYVVIHFKKGDSIYLNVFGEVSGNIIRGKSKWYLYSSQLLDTYKYMTRSKENSQPLLIEDNSVKYFDDSSSVATIPQGTKTVDEYAFYYCSYLTEVHCPSSLEIIDEFAFSHCTNLTNVVLNEGLKVIGNRAFVACEKLNEIIIPESVRQIDEYAFYHTAITRVVIKNPDIVFDKRAFPENCEIVYDN